MRVTVVTDIHGNRRALEAALVDLKQVVPDSRKPEQAISRMSFLFLCLTFLAGTFPALIRGLIDKFQNIAQKSFS